MASRSQFPQLGSSSLSPGRQNSRSLRNCVAGARTKSRIGVVVGLGQVPDGRSKPRLRCGSVSTASRCNRNRRTGYLDGASSLGNDAAGTSRDRFYNFRRTPEAIRHFSRFPQPAACHARRGEELPPVWKHTCIGFRWGPNRLRYVHVHGARRSSRRDVPYGFSLHALRGEHVSTIAGSLVSRNAPGRRSTIV